jgi:putative hydrolase of the HAD superfamily
MQKIRAIIFDLGGVILNLDQEKTLRAFKRLGADLDMMNLESTVFTDFETGKTDANGFRNEIRKRMKGPLHEQVIDDAWNAMLLDLPLSRIEIIESLKKKYKVYLLSNTNEIHFTYLQQQLMKEGIIERWNNLFDKQFLSYQIGHRKPDQEVYRYLTNDISIEPRQCIFIDDSQVNIRAATQAGLHTIWSKHPINDSTLLEIKGINSK